MWVILFRRVISFFRVSCNLVGLSHVRAFANGIISPECRYRSSRYFADTNYCVPSTIQTENLMFINRLPHDRGTDFCLPLLCCVTLPTKVSHSSTNVLHHLTKLDSTLFYCSRPSNTRYIAPLKCYITLVKCYTTDPTCYGTPLKCYTTP